MGEKLILKCLFDIKKLDGKDVYLFKNKDITREPLFLNREVHFTEHNTEVYQYSFRNNSSMKNYSVDYIEKNRTYTLDIFIDIDSRHTDGVMTMYDDYKLSDSACMSFYELDLAVGYYIIDDDVIKTIYYDKAAIMRRNTIKKIIS